MSQSESISGMHNGVIYSILSAIIKTHPNKAALLFELGQFRDSFRDNHIALPVPDSHAQLVEGLLTEWIEHLRENT